MSEFKEMYFRLFDSQTKAIELLQKAQQEMETMYIEASTANTPNASEIHQNETDSKNSS